MCVRVSFFYKKEKTPLFDVTQSESRFHQNKYIATTIASIINSIIHTNIFDMFEKIDAFDDRPANSLGSVIGENPDGSITPS